MLAVYLSANHRYIAPLPLFYVHFKYYVVTKLCLWSAYGLGTKPTRLGSEKENVLAHLVGWKMSQCLVKHIQWFHADMCWNAVMWTWCGAHCRNVNTMGMMHFILVTGLSMDSKMNSNDQDKNHRDEGELGINHSSCMTGGKFHIRSLMGALLVRDKLVVQKVRNK